MKAHAQSLFQWSKYDMFWFGNPQIHPETKIMSLFWHCIYSSTPVIKAAVVYHSIDFMIPLPAFTAVKYVQSTVEAG